MGKDALERIAAEVACDETISFASGFADFWSCAAGLDEHLASLEATFAGAATMFKGDSRCSASASFAAIFEQPAPPDCQFFSLCDAEDTEVYSERNISCYECQAGYAFHDIPYLASEGSENADFPEYLPIANRCDVAEDVHNRAEDDDLTVTQGEDVVSGTIGDETVLVCRGFSDDITDNDAHDRDQQWCPHDRVTPLPAIAVPQLASLPNLPCDSHGTSSVFTRYAVIWWEHIVCALAEISAHPASMTVNFPSLGAILDAEPEPWSITCPHDHMWWIFLAKLLTNDMLDDGEVVSN